MTTLVIATRNRHKTEEIRAVLGPSINFLSLANFPEAPGVIEDGNTFAANAAKKAIALAKWLEENAHGRLEAPAWVLADDSGLEVDALGGLPGVHSARFAALDSNGPGHANSSDAANNSKLLRLLADVPTEQRTARFRCVLALASIRLGTRGPRLSAEADRPVELFEGACEGHMLFAPRGEAGFGYDPLFQPEGYAASFAELGEAVKNGISHRAKALARLPGRLAGRAAELS